MEANRDTEQPPVNPENFIQEQEKNSQLDNTTRALEQRTWRMRELIESEQDYVMDLAQCCQYIYYMRQSKDEDSPEIPMPDDLRQGKDRMIFGNMEMIYEWHRE